MKKAIASNNLQEVKALVSNGADIHMKDGKYSKSGGFSLLHYAVQANDKEIFDYFVSLGVSLHVENKLKTSLLHLASKHNSIDIAKFLIAENFNINEKDYHEKTPFLKAKSIEMIQLFLDNGADINTTTKGGYSLLHNLIDDKYIDVVKFLLDNGIDTSLQTTRKKETALDIAIDYEEEACIKLLKNYGVQKSPFLVSQKVIFDAVEKGDLEKVKELIESGIDINIQDDSGDTLLIVALENKHTEIAYYLLDNGANADVLGFDNHIALHVAVELNDLKCLDAVLSKTTDLEVLSYGEFGTPLHTACFGSNEEVVRKLLDKGADIDALDNYARTPLHIACMEYQESLANFLISNGADQTLVDRFGDLAKDLIG